MLAGNPIDRWAILLGMIFVLIYPLNVVINIQ